MREKKRILFAAADLDLITRLAFFLEDKAYETAVAAGFVAEEVENQGVD